MGTPNLHTQTMLHPTDALRLANARTFLFVPANRPERFDKALKAGADAVIVDLEDAVPAQEKDLARQSITRESALLKASEVPVVVRVNASLDEVVWLRTSDWQPDAIMWPKAGSAAELTAVVNAAGSIPVIPLIESVSGYLYLRELAAVQGVVRLALGHIDFMADSGINCSEDERELDPLRFAMCMASREAGLPAPIDGVTTALKDAVRIGTDVVRAMRFGFGGKLCIHPSQLECVHRSMAPSADEFNWAKQVLAAQGRANGAAVQIGGQMVDLPVILRAQTFLARAQAM